jgi:6-phosphogluconolactonase
MKKQVEIVADRETVIARSLDIILEKIEIAIEQRGIFTIALAGGGTPKPLYEKLATLELPWEKMHIFWGDERYVAPEHPDSNEGMARQAWLNKVPIPPSNIHPMPTGAGDPALDAQKHERELQDFFQINPGEIPSLDIILLGIGDDAHTASLFPHTEALKVRSRLVTVGNKDGQPRITFTVPLINQAQTVIFMVTGASKQGALEQIFAQTADENHYPARLIHPQGELWWLLDHSAGEKLELK